jgi:Carboxypeptidase regulatory-like domain/TonB-dependent Receptor Plug Domain
VQKYSVTEPGLTAFTCLWITAGKEKSSSMAMFRRTSGRVLFLLVLGAFVLASSPLAAQITRGAISGVVRDPSGLVVPGATVTVTNTETRLIQSAATDADGFYRVAALEPGRYTVKTELQGFAAVEAKDIVVPPSSEVRVSVDLKVGALTETVSVTGDALAVSLNKTSPTIGVTIGAKQVSELPLPGGRNINNLILTAPNVSMAGFTNGAGQGTYIVNGQRSRNNNYMIDGSDNNDISVTISTASLVPESVAEFQVLTNPYSVEFGRNTGGQINVITKSGGDLFKGDLWDYYTTSKFYSLTNLEKASGLTEPARYYRHQAGGDIGGPIIRGKTFFYGLYQYDPQRPAATPNSTTVRMMTPAGFAALQNVPLGPGQTAASRQAVLSRLSFLNDVYASGATFRTLQNTLVNGVPIETGNSNVNIISPSTYKTLQLRVDHKVTNNITATVRELYNPKIDQDANGISNCVFGSIFCGSQDLKDQNFAASVTQVLDSTKLNEFRFSGVRRNLDFPENDPKSPTATISGLFTIGGASNFPQSRLSNTFQFSDTFTWTKTRHTIKAGADIRYNLLDNVAAFDSKGTFTFDNLQNYMNNLAASFRQALQTATWTAKQWQSFLFMQDDFRLTPSLTLNMGLRYEVSSVPLGFFGATDALSLGALVPGPVQRDTNNWAPRIGAAWSPSSKNKIIGDGKSVFRAGFGMGYDVLFYNLLVVDASNYPNVVVPQLNNVQDLYPNVAPLTGAAVFNPLATFTNSAADTQSPESRFYSASWQRDIGSVLLEIGYTGSRGYKGINQWEMNPAILTPAQAALAAAGQAIPSVQSRRLFPLFGSRVTIPAYVGPNGVDAEARSTYNAVYFSANKRISHGVQVAASYTYSSFYSNNDASLGEGGTDGSSQRPQSFFDIASEWSVSQFDRPHRFTSSYSWEIPGPKSSILGQVLGGWQWTGVTQIQSGRPFTIITGVDSNGDGAATPGADRPNINPSGSIVWDDAHASFVNNGYYVAPTGSNGLPLANALGNGNAPRNSERGARFLKTDFSLIKNFKAGGNRVVLIRADALNVFMNPDYGIPVANMSSPSFGQNTNNWGRRSFQLSAKVSF